MFENVVGPDWGESPDDGRQIVEIDEFRVDLIGKLHDPTDISDEIEEFLERDLHRSIVDLQFRVVQLFAILYIFMDNLTAKSAQKHFEVIKSVDDMGKESWSARELMIRLGYNKWENFEKVINRAKTACSKSGFKIYDHFPEVRKMISIATGSTRETSRIIVDYSLTRYACYLIAQNGDSRKEEIALAQTYFAVQTRRQEIAQAQTKEFERLSAREKLTATEKKFSGVMFERGIKGAGIARIRARGDQKLFGGRTTQEMKKKLAIPSSRALADFLPTITIKAKDLAAEMTTFKAQEKNLKSEEPIARTHESHNTSVRQALVEQGIHPEHLPREEDVKKLERKVRKSQKKLAVTATISPDVFEK